MAAFRVALCQADTTVGAFVQNVDKICEFLKKAGEQKAQLAVFPELAISSYPPLDLLDRPGFISANQSALDQLLARIPKIADAPQTIILGSFISRADASGRALHNAAVVIHEGKIVHTQAKRLLPTYDVFDEHRYFEPGTTTTLWDSPWGKLGISVCEDAWFDEMHNGRRLYRDDPAADLKGADFVINISASPFEINKRQRRKSELASFVRRINAPLIYVNQVGANDEILFDGASLVYSADGRVIFEMPSFREGIAVVEFESKAPGAISNPDGWIWQNEGKIQWEKQLTPGVPTSEIELLHRGLVTGIRDYFRKTGFKRAVIGLSGGIDSAVVACLAAEALGPNHVLGVSMPSQYSSSHSLADAESLAKNIGLEYRIVSIKFMFTSLLMELKPAFAELPPDVTEENIQARMRAVILMALANKRNGLVLTTGNKSELGVGYCTTYGDMAGALGPLGDVYKMRVYELAKFINAKHGWIPASTISKPPSAELRPNQTDQDSLPPYDLLDRLLEAHFEGAADERELVEQGFEQELVRRILKLVRNSEFKRRQAAPVIKTTSKAFGLGRRIPVAKA
jgi:NAD+ synthase (glutamine-hydrolysing)